MKYLAKPGEIINVENKSWIRATEDKNGNIEYTLLPMVLSAYLKENSNIIYVKNDATQQPFTYCYKDGYYQLYSDNELMAFIKQFIPQQLINSKDIKEILFDLKTQLKFIDIEKLNDNESIINFEDGLYNIYTKEFLPHSPDILSTIQIPAKYEDVLNSDGDAPIFDNYLMTLVDKDADCYLLLLQCLGLCISNVRGYRTKKSLFLVGDGDTGKSQIKKIAETLIGIKNISNIDLKKINERFGASSLYQKRLAGCNDMTYQKIVDMSIFKQLTGGDSVEIEFKNKDKFTFLYKGFLWFNCNQLPMFGGDTGVWVYDRIMPIKCKNVIPPEKRDPELFEKIMTEKNAIIKKALSALHYIIENNYKFIEPKCVKEARESYTVDNSTLLTFIEECCYVHEDISFRLKRSEFKQAYTNYVKLNFNGNGKVSTKVMNRILLERYEEDFIKSNGIWYMKKIRLTKEAREELGISNYSNYC